MVESKKKIEDCEKNLEIQKSQYYFKLKILIQKL